LDGLIFALKSTSIETGRNAYRGYYQGTYGITSFTTNSKSKLAIYISPKLLITVFTINIFLELAKSLIFQ
jgi:hypothetical protein